MKTPREILLQRHQAAQPRLDEIRRTPFPGSRNRPGRGPTGCRSARCSLLWRELIWPCHRTWAGLAAVWLVLLTLQLASRDSAEVAARKTPPPSPEVLMVLRQQQLLLAELVERPAPRAADRPKTAPARPRSQRQEEMGIA